MPAFEFAWVLQPAARPGEDSSNLLYQNYRFIEYLKPYIKTVWVEDHFQWDSRPMLECWTTLTYLAAKYPDLIVAPLVLGQSYRNPALVAKMAATLHYLTGGRMIMRIGAGWKEDEYTSYGWDYPSAQVRIGQLDEAIQIIKAMWSQSPANFNGQYYSLKNAYCEPRPDPAPLFMIGGGGEKYALRVVAKHADWWNCPFTTVQKFDHKLHVLENHCKEIGRALSTIRKTYFGFLSVSHDPSKLIKREGLHVIAGNPDDVSSEIQRFVDLGVDYFIFRFLDFPELDGADLFLKEVLPRFQ